MTAKIKEIENEIYINLKTPTCQQRRSVVINEMKQLEMHQIGCFNCDGHCCSKQSNSMKITPLEALELFLSLVNQEDKQDLNLLKEKLKKNISEFRLDHEVYTGKKHNNSMRKTYDCPFFTSGNKGCSIRLENKPYGCLSFNPKLINDNGSNCGLNEELFLAREQQYLEDENRANKYLKDKLKIHWDKLEIPRALLFMIDLALGTSPNLHDLE